ncbi:unnamed protein product [Prunus armeniaca]|uniref:Retrotransposon Copia-like N-terminal domain-containing protein n=1 Tax=Prunus armeniaca TaxID=36596 RepID=A0A6J5UFY0_PRUAR|nr:unnamed protein product [Prunus armeniaca]
MPYALFAMCFVSVAIMGDDSKVVVHSSAFRTKEDRPSRDYSAPITPDKLDSSNYAFWSRGARFMITSSHMASFINGKKPGLDPPFDGVRGQILALNPVPFPLEAYAIVMKEDTRQSAMLGGGAATLKVDSTCN